MQEYNEHGRIFGIACAILVEGIIYNIALLTGGLSSLIGKIVTILIMILGGVVIMHASVLFYNSHIYKKHQAIEREDKADEKHK